MHSALLDFWIRINSSYWFIPSVMSILALGLAFLMVAVEDAFHFESLGMFAWAFKTQSDGARSLLATVAGSIITVAGVTFSMTLLMVSHASAQIGPRVISGFMRDRGSQLVLGTLIGTFLYCIMVLRTVRSGVSIGVPGDTVHFVPHLAVVVAIGLALLSVAALIYFIHHVSMRINVEQVTSETGSKLLRQLDRIYPTSLADAKADAPSDANDYRLFDKTSTIVALERNGGYLRVLDHDGLVDVAQELGCVLQTLVRPGDFCVRGTPLIRKYGGADVQKESVLQELFTWGDTRTHEQDVLYLIGQLAEIAVKALSPGVNNQFTAAGCIDQMELVLRAISDRPEPNAYSFDKQGALRVISEPLAHSEIADCFLIPVRQFSLGDFITSFKLVQMLERSLTFCADQSALYQTLLQHFIAIRDDSRTALAAASQRDMLLQRCARIEGQLGRRNNSSQLTKTQTSAVAE